MREKIFKKPTINFSKKAIIVILIIIALAAAMFLFMNMMKGENMIDFRTLSEGEIPQDMTNQVIPEYRDLERALACSVDDKVYVLVTRGEKPTSGYDLAIESMELETNDGQENLIVNVIFKDPEQGSALAQVLTYPFVVAETELTELPDTIELRINY